MAEEAIPRKERDLECEYPYDDCGLGCAHQYLLPHVIEILSEQSFPPKSRILDLGCGNGAVAAELARHGYEVVGVDPSKSGIRLARDTHPDLEFHYASAYDPLAKELGQFATVISLEVIEHLYYPRKFAHTVRTLLEPGGLTIISTPFHGYVKNLALALTGKLDNHFTALWTHGHIKFWSMRTMRSLLEEEGFEILVFRRAGRIPLLAKSMIAVATVRQTSV